MSKKSYYFITVLLFLSIFISRGIAESYAIDIFGNQYTGHIDPYESIELDFVNFNKEFSLTANTSVDFSVQYSSPLLDRQISIAINDSTPVTINMSFGLDITEFLPTRPNIPTVSNLSFVPNYHSVLKFVSNTSIDSLNFTYEKNLLLGIFPDNNYTIAYFTSDFIAWQVVDTQEHGVNDTTIINGQLSEIEAGEEYFVTLYNIESDPPPPPPRSFPWIWIIITSILIVLVVAVSIVMSKEEYVRELKSWVLPGTTSSHNLTFEEVLENKNRDKIIELVLNEPGIHFNELLRRTELSAGNLAWHLDVLESYKIIRKERFEHYLVYFPYYQKNPLSNIELKLQKSELTLRILKLIEDDPGMWNNQITEKLEINRKTIAYHIEKLKELNLIEVKKEGRKKKIFPKNESEKDIT